jgi:hypothetical protein
LFSRDIKCPKCGQEGKVEAVDTIDVIEASKLFKILGKDSSGFLHFLCPACGEDINIDPLSFMKDENSGEFNKLALEESTIYHLKKVKSTTINLIGILLLALIFSIIAALSHTPIWLLIKLGLFILIIFMLRKISHNIKLFYAERYFGYGGFPTQRRNILIINYVNIVLILLIIILTVFETAYWISVFLTLSSIILLTPIIFWVEGARSN